MKYEEITSKIIQAAYNVHKILGAGFLEKVYQKAMLVELREMELTAEEEYSIPVYYKNELVGDFNADLFVEKCIIVELKATEQLNSKHEVQTVNYLTATKMDVGLLINFGQSVQVKRKYREYKPKKILTGLTGFTG